MLRELYKIKHYTKNRSTIYKGIHRKEPDWRYFYNIFCKSIKKLLFPNQLDKICINKQMKMIENIQVVYNFSNPSHAPI